jgi:hypothetical protein
MKVYSYYDFQMCKIQEDDGPIYRTKVGDNSLMDIHSIINIIHNNNILHLKDYNSVPFLFHDQ